MTSTTQSVQLKPVQIKSSGQKLKATLVYPQKTISKAPGLLFVHGWTSSQSGYIPRAKAVAEKGYICLTFSMRGHGKSDGKLSNFSRQDHLNDVVQAFDFLKKQPKVSKNKIGVCGASYGGYLASILTSKRSFKWLALRAPALYKDKNFKKATKKLITNDVKVYRQGHISPEENMALKALLKFKNDVLLVVSQHDESIPEQTIRNYLLAINHLSNLEKRVILGADHALSNQKSKDKFIDILKDWFEGKK